MSTYDDEMFNFLVEEENLKGLIVAKNQFPVIRERLIRDFWNKTAEIIKNKIQENQRWEIVIWKDILSSESTLYLRDKNIQTVKSELPPILFCWDMLSSNNPRCGLWVNPTLEDSKKKILREEFEKIRIELFQDFENSGNWPLIQIYKGLDFSNDNMLIKITPKNQDEKANELAEILFDLFERMHVHYDKIIYTLRN